MGLYRRGEVCYGSLYSSQFMNINDDVRLVVLGVSVSGFPRISNFWSCWPFHFFSLFTFLKVSLIRILGWLISCSSEWFQLFKLCIWVSYWVARPYYKCNLTSVYCFSWYLDWASIIKWYWILAYLDKWWTLRAAQHQIHWSCDPKRIPQKGKWTKS